MAVKGLNPAQDSLLDVHNFHKTQVDHSCLGLLPSFMVLYVSPQKPYGLLGTGEEWDREPRPTSLFTLLLSSRFLWPELVCMSTCM